MIEDKNSHLTKDAMKKIIILTYVFFLGITLLNAQTVSKQEEKAVRANSAAPEKFILEGIAKGFEDSTKVKVNVFGQDMSLDLVNETIVYILNGKFVLKGDFEQPTKLSIRFRPKDPENLKDYEEVYIWVENKKMYLEGEKGKMFAAQVKGSWVQDQYAEYVSKIAPFHIERKQIWDSIMTIKDLPATMRTEFKSRINRIDQERNKISNEFIFSHPEYYFTSTEIALDLKYSFNVLDRKRINQFFDQLPDEYKTNACGKQIKDFIKSGTASTELSNKEFTDINIKEGKKAPDFKLKTVSSENFSLYSITGKYIVLDFWGSWCGGCIAELPRMKEYYNKCKKQIEFIGIACNEKSDTWKNSIQSNQLDWIQVINEKDLKSDVASMYGIKAFPTKIILDKKKKIIGIFNNGEDFYKKLDELMMHH
jgi:thiol-disulfide isomerase/thioredoxin